MSDVVRSTRLHCGRAAVFAAIASLAAVSCSSSEASSPRPSASAIGREPPAIAESDSDATPWTPAPASRSDSARASACEAPSVTRLRAADDARDLAALDRCTWRDPYLVMMEREQPAAARCGLAPYARAVDVARMLDAAPPLDAATASHVRAIFASGKTMGRRPDVFGLVGDSMTIDRAFLRPFRASSDDRLLFAPSVERALAVEDGRSIIDVFRGVAAAKDGDEVVDAFRAPRAARVGALTSWATTPDARGRTPVDAMIDDLSPAYAIVMLGTNDAANRIAPLDDLARDFEKDLARVVDALETRGVVPILTTLPKHMRDKRFADCPVKGTPKSNYRYAIQTNAISAAVASLACTRSLPLVDVRWAIDPLLDHGVGKDGVHPSRFYKGGGVLDEAGLQCGYNAKNFVTLRALALVHAAATSREAAP